MTDLTSRVSRPELPPGDVADGMGRRRSLAVLASTVLAATWWWTPDRKGLLVPDTLRESSISRSPWPRTLVDPLGRAFRWEAPPKRILSLVLAADEILVELVPPERLLGCTAYVDDVHSTVLAGRFPRSVPRVASEIERVLAADPDLVVVAGYTSIEFVFALLDVGVPTLRVERYHHLVDVERLIETLGLATGEDERAGRLLARFRARLSRVAHAVAGRPRPKALIYQAGGYSVGSGTMIDELVERAGGLNVVRSLGVEGHVRLGEEAILASDPDVVVVTAGLAPPLSDAAALLPTNLSTLRAVRLGRVVGLPAAWLGSVSHHVADGLEGLARAFHPGAFADRGPSPLADDEVRP